MDTPFKRYQCHLISQFIDQHPRTTVEQISKHLGVLRQNAYPLIREMLKLEYIQRESVTKNKVKVYLYSNYKPMPAINNMQPPPKRGRDLEQAPQIDLPILDSADYQRTPRLLRAGISFVSDQKPVGKVVYGHTNEQHVKQCQQYRQDVRQNKRRNAAISTGEPRL